MDMPTFVYIVCCGVYGLVTAICGYGVATWQFWVGLILIIVSHISGRERGDGRYQS